MDSELVAANEQKIIIPTIFRDDYLTSLKALSQSSRVTPFVQVLDFAQRYTNPIQWDDFNQAKASLEATHAFLKANEAEDKGVRLVLPKAGVQQ